MMSNLPNYLPYTPGAPPGVIDSDAQGNALPAHCSIPDCIHAGAAHRQCQRPTHRRRNRGTFSFNFECLSELFTFASDDGVVPLSFSASGGSGRYHYPSQSIWQSAMEDIDPTEKNAYDQWYASRPNWHIPTHRPARWAPPPGFRRGLFAAAGLAPPVGHHPAASSPYNAFPPMSPSTVMTPMGHGRGTPLPSPGAGLPSIVPFAGPGAPALPHPGTPGSARSRALSPGTPGSPGVLPPHDSVPSRAGSRRASPRTMSPGILPPPSGPASSPRTPSPAQNPVPVGTPQAQGGAWTPVNDPIGLPPVIGVMGSTNSGQWSVVQQPGLPLPPQFGDGLTMGSPATPMVPMPGLAAAAIAAPGPAIPGFGHPLPGTQPLWTPAQWHPGLFAQDAPRGEIQLAPWLIPNPRSTVMPHMLWDVTEHPSQIRRMTQRGLVVPFATTDNMTQQATFPPAHMIHMYIPGMRKAWGPCVVSSDGPVEVQQIFYALWEYLQTPLTTEDMRALLSGPEGEARFLSVEFACYRRCARSLALPAVERRQGLKRVDVLEGNTVFWGMWPSYQPDGGWFLCVGLSSQRVC